MSTSADDFIENRTFDEIAVGDSARSSHTLTRDDIWLFATVSGDANPTHFDDSFHRIVGHGMWGGTLISAVIGTKLPGPGSIYVEQDLHFLNPIMLGDTVTITVTVREKRQSDRKVILDCRAINQDGGGVIEGRATVIAPAEKIRLARVEQPEIRVGRHERYHALMARCKGKPPVATAIIHPCDPLTLGAAVEAAAAGLIAPILVGPEAKIRAAAAAASLDISAFPLENTPHSHAAAQRSVELVRQAKAQMLMKGSLSTDEMMEAVMAPDSGLKTARLVSHVYLFDVPGYPRPLLITDAGLNIAPTLMDKRDIIQNAIDLARMLGIARPKVAILSATETVNPKLVSTLDAAALCKMADRGQITDGLVEGPLAFDNAISPQAARDKGIVSPVAGYADILLAPDLEAGNMLAKQLLFMAGADAAGVVLGARVPIVYTSRADGERTRMASCAVAAEMARARPYVAA